MEETCKKCSTEEKLKNPHPTKRGEGFSLPFHVKHKGIYVKIKKLKKLLSMLIISLQDHSITVDPPT
jgi:hypothetical protein